MKSLVVLVSLGVTLMVIWMAGFVADAQAAAPPRAASIAAAMMAPDTPKT